MQSRLVLLSVLVAVPVSGGSSGCANSQRLTIHTAPTGARVTLARYGKKKAAGGIPGVVVSGTADKFQDEPLDLGTSPVDYEFPLTEEEEGFHGPGVFVQVDKVYEGGLLRAERDGAFAERRITFMGDPIEVDLKLEAIVIGGAQDDSVPPVPDP